MQIRQHIRWIEHTWLAADCHQLKTQSEMQGVSIEENANQYLDQQYYMLNSQNDPVNLYSFVCENQGDSAFKTFIPKLKDNILERLLKWNYKGNMYSEFTDKEQNIVHIAGEWIYRCKTVKINYTTYNIRCDGDTINPQTYPDIMVTSPETGPNAQPYWYAHVIGIFHIMVLLTHPELEVTARSQHQMDFFVECCHRLSMWLNCHTGLSPSIVSIIVILPITSTLRMLMHFYLIFPCSFHLALGQRPSPMYYTSCHCLVILHATLEGFLLLMLTNHIAWWLIAYSLLTDHLLIADRLPIVLLLLLVTDLTHMTRVFYRPSRGLSYK